MSSSLVGFASLIPILVLGLVGALLADRHDRRVLLLSTLLFNAGALVVLAVLTGASRANPAVILTFALVTGVSNALTWPAWQAMINDMVPPAVLGRLAGIWVIVTSGTTPVGSLAIGALSAAIGVQWAVGLGGLGCVLCGVLLTRAPY